MNSQPKFKVGDIVRLKTGKSPQKVLKVLPMFDRKSYVLRCAYFSDIRYAESLNEPTDAYCRKTRPETDYVLYEDQPKENIVPDLYQLKKEPERFGTALQNSAGQPLRNSNGHIVLEMKGEGGKVEAFAEADIELVTPFTVNLCRLSILDNRSGDQIHVIAEAGQVEKDDVLLELNTGHIWRVTQLDTKCRSAKTNVSKWLKLSTQTIKFGLND